jgi:hypothetical protein
MGGKQNSKAKGIVRSDAKEIVQAPVASSGICEIILVNSRNPTFKTSSDSFFLTE